MVELTRVRNYQDYDITDSASARRWGGYGFNSRPNASLLKTLKIVLTAAMLCEKNDYYFANLGLPDKGRVVKKLVICRKFDIKNPANPIDQR